MIADRRSLRASSPLLAAEFYLDAERSRSGACALVLFETGAVMVSSSDSGDDLSEVLRAVAGDESGDRDLYSHPLSFKGKAVVLASLGARVPSVLRVERDLGRILAA